MTALLSSKVVRHTSRYAAGYYMLYIKKARNNKRDSSFKIKIQKKTNKNKNKKNNEKPNV